jgi:hypothetical protein
MGINNVATGRRITFLTFESTVTMCTVSHSLLFKGKQGTRTLVRAEYGYPNTSN